MSGAESPDEMSAIVTYRMAYGLAADLADGLATGIDDEPSRWSLEHYEAWVLAEVLREIGTDADLDVVREAVADAIAGRRPIW
jgi:hypothetical protein